MDTDNEHSPPGDDGNRKPRRRRPLGLQVQFQIALGLVFLLFCVVTAWLIYSHEKQLIAQNALSKSRIVLAAVESTRAYIRNTLRPKMYTFAGKDAFILEAMSTSYVTRAVMDNFSESLPEYRYRRVAVHARNPASEPTPVELEMIEFFRTDPDRGSWRGIRETDGGVGFLHVKPVFMGKSCLKCHGTPDDAPASLIDLYGDKRGFGYRENELAGITAVSIPVQVALKKIRRQALSVFWVTLVLLGLLYVLISFLFNRMVVRSLQGLLGIFRSGLMDDEEIALLTAASSKDEIHELSEAAEELTSHLKTARGELARYAEELEQRVADRTRELEISRARLRDKVTARNRELRTLNRIAELITRSFRLADILPGVLEETLGLIPARGAAIYLLTRDKEKPALRLEFQRDADKLSHVIGRDHQRSSGEPPGTLLESIWVAAQGTMSQFACQRNQNCLNIPLICRDRVLGVMTFVGVDFGETSPEMQALLLSVGQQVGITIDSLGNVSALLQSKELLQAVFDGIPDIMVLLGPDLKIRMVNKAYLKRHQVSLGEVLNKPCGAVDISCNSPEASKQLARALSRKEQSREEVTTEIGEIFQVYYYPILDESGEVWGVLRYAREVTLEKQVEQRIQQTEKLAAIGQLAAGVAHEINNPMGIILCYTDLIKRQVDAEEQVVRDVETIEKQAKNCQRIVSDLLKFSRSRRTEPEPADANAALKQVIEMVRQQFRNKGIEIAVDLSPDLPLVPFDRDKMKQVFLNLLMNARQAISAPAGKIRARTRFNPTAACVEIAIHDNGSGIDPGVIEKIFDPFFSTKQTGEGTGLGLSVSYGIIKDHGGELRVDSEIGRWTEFTIQLPVKKEGDDK